MVRLLPVIVFALLVSSGDVPRSIAREPDRPILLDKWARYHTHITAEERPGRKQDGSTDYGRFIWVPKVAVVVQMANPKRDDVVIFQHYRGEQPWGDPIKVPAATITARRGRDYSLVTVSGMMDWADASEETGEHSVRVSYKQTSSDLLHQDLAEFRYTVKPYNRGWTSKGPVQGFYVDQDFRIGEAWLYRLSDNRIELWTWFKYDRQNEAIVRNGKLRLYRGDEVIEFGNRPTRRTEVAYDHYSSQRDRVQVKWGLWYWSVPKINGLMAADYLTGHPGDYRCVLTQNGEASREFHFTVAGDNILREPFEGSKAIHAVDDSFPLKMVLKNPQDLPFDRKAFATKKLYSRR
ncbi:MAG: hypothetical protein AAGA03_08570 [Planctomycetota bacterium]